MNQMITQIVAGPRVQRRGTGDSEGALCGQTLEVG